MVTKYKKDGVVYLKHEIKIYKDKHIIFNPKHEVLISEGYELVDETLDIAKNKMIDDIEIYDKSNNINKFYINNVEMWLTKTERISIKNAVNIAKENNINSYNFWHNNIKYIIDCNKLIEMLNAIELYSIECLNITNEHIAYIKSATDVNAINTYDYKTNYPNILMFEI